jgi:uncharacterized membrane protein YkvA (DUF1232 family)
MTRWFLRLLTSSAMRDLARRSKNLSTAQRLDLARRIKADHRLPLKVRYLLPLVVLYVGLPLDFIPDFIPVVGKLDDLAAMTAGSALLFRHERAQVLEEHLAAVEAGVAGDVPPKKFISPSWRWL